MIELVFFATTNLFRYLGICKRVFILKRSVFSDAGTQFPSRREICGLVEVKKRTPKEYWKTNGPVTGVQAILCPL